MKAIFLFMGILLLSSFSYSQTVLLKGKVTEAITQEPVYNAIVQVGGNSTQTNSAGTFQLQVGSGKILIFIHKEGYENDTFELENVKPNTEYLFGIESSSAQMKAIEITASISRGRKTPVAFTNLSGRDISERLGSADLPMLLNTTPGVYATQSGGGAGDSRINIRGFNQRNISVMIDGVPVNDMENGWVYWSNWFGLSEVTALTQIQRGLGNSRMANPAVGGTMNIVTRGVSDQFRVSVNSEIGDSKYKKYSATVNSGKLPGNFGIVASFTRRTCDGYVDKLYDDMYAFYGRIEKQIGKRHTLSFTAIGAPQSHGQRTFRVKLSLYDTTLAKETKLDNRPAKMPIQQGRRYNQHWGSYYELTKYKGDTIRKVTLNERENMFFKPQYYLKHDWKPSYRSLLSTVVYMSTGNGGGTQAVDVPQNPSVYGNYDFQSVYNKNSFITPFTSPIDPAYSTTLKKSSGIISRSVNQHKWVGLLSTYHTKINKYFTFTGGVDLRTYHAYHYSQVWNLLGGDYYRPNTNELNPFQKEKIYLKGQKFHHNNDGLVRWAGVFGETEYTYRKLTAFINASGTRTYYSRIDSFKPDSNMNPGKTGWVGIWGYTFKTGANYNISKKLNVYSNLGILNRPARYSNVFDNRNTKIVGTKNEKVYAWEAGAGYKLRKLLLDANTYVTYWNNRPVDALPSYQDLDGNTFTYNITGLKALHLGFELAAQYKWNDYFNVNAAMSLGDWRWKSGSRAIVNDASGDSVGVVDFSAKNVHVGDAAQRQLSLGLRYEPKLLKKNLYLSTQFVWFGKQYADFEPTALIGAFKDHESFQLPNYWYLNVSAGYNIRSLKNYLITIYANGQNITNNLYITDAQHRNQGNTAATFDPGNLEVFVSTGFRFTAGLRITFTNPNNDKK